MPNPGREERVSGPPSAHRLEDSLGEMLAISGCNDIGVSRISASRDILISVPAGQLGVCNTPSSRAGFWRFTRPLHACVTKSGEAALRVRLAYGKDHSETRRS